MAEARKWAVTHRIVTRMRTQDNKIVPTNTAVFRMGDFVEVTFSLEVIYSHGKNGGTVQARLAPHEVVRLMGARYVEVSCPLSMMHCKLIQPPVFLPGHRATTTTRDHSCKLIVHAT